MTCLYGGIEMIKISVIVAVYKAEAYLYRCVDSLLAQTFTDFEILLIDDGSPDRSGEICDEYARKDARIRVFHKANEGVGATRQFGIDHACGEYSIHADPDDWVEPTMLEELYRKAKETDADMVICDYYVDFPHKTTYRKQEPTSLDSPQLMKDLFQRLHAALWNKLIKSSCYQTREVHFIKGINYREDLLVNMQILKHETKVAYLPRAFYHYDQILNSGSITRSITYEYYKVSEEVYKHLRCLLHDYHELEDELDREGIRLLYILLEIKARRRELESKKTELGLNLDMNRLYSMRSDYRVLLVFLSLNVNHSLALFLCRLVNRIKSWSVGLKLR